MEFSLLDLDDLGVVKYRYTEQDKKNVFAVSFRDPPSRQPGREL